MKFIVDETAIDDSADFVDPVTKKKAAIEHRHLRFVLSDESAVQ
jgi:hypothetical protein